MTSIPKEQRKYISDLHFDHKLWANQINFSKQELDLLEVRLEEIVTRNTDREVRAQVEHYQNQFIREREVMDELLHDLNAHQHELSQYAIDHPVAVDHVYFEDHGELRKRMDMFNKIYQELKHEYLRFVAKWM